MLKFPWGISVTEDNVFVTDIGFHAIGVEYGGARGARPLIF